MRRYGLKDSPFSVPMRARISGEDSDVDILVEIEPQIGLGFVELADRIEDALGAFAPKSSRAGRSSHVIGRSSKRTWLMSRRATPLLVEDIWEAIEKIQRYVAGLDHDTFIKDDKTIDLSSAIWKSSAKPPIACRRISEPSTRRSSGAKIIGLRNRIVHDYFNIDVEIVWEIIQTDLPNLKSKLQSSARDRH